MKYLFQLATITNFILLTTHTHAMEPYASWAAIATRNTRQQTTQQYTQQMIENDPYLSDRAFAKLLEYMEPLCEDLLPYNQQLLRAAALADKERLDELMYDTSSVEQNSTILNRLISCNNPYPTNASLSTRDAAIQAVLAVCNINISLNTQLPDYDLPLQKAIQRKVQLNTLAKLIKAGASLRNLNNWQQTALDVAREQYEELETLQTECLESEISPDDLRYAKTVWFFLEQVTDLSRTKSELDVIAQLSEELITSTENTFYIHKQLLDTQKLLQEANTSLQTVQQELREKNGQAQLKKRANCPICLDRRLRPKSFKCESCKQKMCTPCAHDSIPDVCDHDDYGPANCQKCTPTCPFCKAPAPSLLTHGRPSQIGESSSSAASSKKKSKKRKRSIEQDLDDLEDLENSKDTAIDINETE